MVEKVAATKGSGAARGGPWEGVDVLYRAQHSPMVRLAHLITGSNEVAQEVVHDAFVKIQARWNQVREPAGYLRRIVVNESRSRQRRRSVELRHATGEPSPLLPPEIDETWTALARIPARRRAALVLRYYDDLSIDDIAATLGCRPGTAKSLIHRGLHSLKEVLES